MALDAAEQAQIRALADELDKLRRAVRGVPPKYEGLQWKVTRLEGQGSRLQRLIDGDAEIKHTGLLAQLESISARMSVMEGQLKQVVDAKSAETHQREGMMMALRLGGLLLGSNLLLQVAQLFGVIQP